MKIREYLLSRWKRLSALGIIDGISTVTASLGSKVQTLALLALITRAHGVEGAGETILATSTAILLVALSDMGLSPQVTRLFARQELYDRHVILRPLFLRVAALAPASVVAALFTLSNEVPQSGLLLWMATIFLYATGYQCSMTATQLAYGIGKFKQAAALNGVLRSSSVLVLLLLAYIQAQVICFVLVLAITELAIAGLQYKLVGSPTVRSRVDHAELRFGAVWRYGVGSVANTIMNRSDAVVVSLVAGAGVIGIYGLASQVENALTTAALIPAGAVMAYTAKAVTHAEQKAIGNTTAWLVGVAYCFLTLPFLIFTEESLALLFGVTVSDPLPFRICMVAGLFSCLGGVAMQQVTGKGQATAAAKVWAFTAVFAVAALLVGSATWGAVGAAVAAFARDLAFWVAARLATRKRHASYDVQTKVEV